MHSNRQSHRRQHGDRSSRQRDDVDDRWEERREPHRDVPRDPYPKYGGNGHGSAERTNKSREYTDSSKRGYSKDTVGREWSRKSPVRGPTSSPDWGAAEKKRQKFAEGEEDRYRREPEDKKYRQSPDSYSQQEDDFKYRKTSQDSRHRHRHEEFTYRQQHDNDYRQPSGYYKDGDHHENSWDRLEERTRSQESSTKSFESETTNRSPTVFEPKSTKGFQRFLDVLNKGVNVDTLTKIVTQTSPEVSDGPRSPGSFMTTADSVWCPSSAGRQQGTHQNNHHWSESEGSQRLASPQPHHRSFSPKGCSPSDEKSLQRSDGGQSYYNLKSRSRSPTLVKNITLTPEDEHKQRQMQDVLQAIGMDLGSEELGQMSHRIQERLYGKKDSDRGRQWGGTLPPNMPHVDPRLLLPPYIPYSYSPPLNMSVLTQRSHLLPTSYPQSAFFNLPNVNPLPPLNTAQKAKTQTRPRCLQVIETKQPG
ncbi:putative cyclin-dependent kinase 12-like [Scophthalmus maximus]|uniref:Putative cyclin-dependent kinase 12-like n=1 Tax=Scophthalmus maximus TaxID=52904 RepID=A0A2U9BQT0_SCOMX|nr:putative cyclin-dependent kinase 12-like [Scophthalmus maximus]